MECRLLTRQEVESLTGLGRSTIYRLMRLGKFPTPIRIGGRAVRWSASELQGFLRDCPRATGEGGAEAK